MVFNQLTGEYGAVPDVQRHYKQNGIGTIVVGDEKPYEYLTKTISNFPSQENFKKIIEGTKFKDVNYRNIFNGIVAIHNATKIINAQ